MAALLGADYDESWFASFYLSEVDPGSDACAAGAPDVRFCIDVCC